MVQKVWVSLLMIFALLFTSCVSKTMVTFTTEKEGAEVFVDGESIGKTPARVKLSNAVWENPDIIIEQEGYKNAYYELEKSLKPANLLLGIFLWWPTLLYVWGPDDTQSIQMIEE